MQDRTYLFEQAPVSRAVMSMAAPTIASSLVMVLYNLADTYFVGMLNDPIQNAAVTLAAPVLLAFNAINNLFGVGSSSMMSRAMGRGDRETVRRSSSFGFWCALLCGALLSVSFTAFSGPALAVLGATEENATATSAYLFWTTTCGAVPAILNVVLAYMVRSEGAALHAGIGTMSGCFLNILLDPVFILPWGLNMGAAGAGLATFLSNCVACGYFLVLLAVRRHSSNISLRPALPGRAIVVGVCAVGIPAAVQNLLNVTGMTVLNNFTSVYGSNAVAAMGIAQKVNQVPFYVALGLSQGLMPLVSYNYASGDYRRMKRCILFALKVAMAFLIALCVFDWTCSAWLVRLFMKDAEIVAYGSRFLRGMCLCLPFLGVDFLAVGVFQACGMGRRSLIFAVLRKIVMEIPALCILNWIWPLYGLAYAQTCAEIILCLVAAVVLRRLFRDLGNPPAPDTGVRLAKTAQKE